MCCGRASNTAAALEVPCAGGGLVVGVVVVGGADGTGGVVMAEVPAR